MASDKKPRATPNTIPFGLTARENEIAILSLRCRDENGKASINKQQLAELAHLGNAESSGRAWRRIEAKIKEAPVESTTGPGTPANGKGGDDAAATAAAAAAAAADPDSPSVLASDKKKNKKKAAGGGKATGSKRTKKEADDGGSGDEDENEGGERPKKIPKHVRGKPVVTLKKLEATQGLDDDFDEV